MEPKPSLDSQAQEMVLLLDRIFERLMAMIPVDTAGAEIPLTFAEVRAAKSVPPDGAISMRQLADALGVPLPTATHMVSRLVEKGIVVRVRPEYDRRVVLVELSASFKAHRQALFEKRVELLERILQPLTPEVRDQVLWTFNEIAKAATTQVDAIRASAAGGGQS